MPKKLLIVDDDDDTRIVLRDRLLSMGFEVVTENNGHSALSRIDLEARQGPIQGILLDLQMPMLDGMAVLGEIQKYHREIPVIMMSATADFGQLKKTLDVGARGYLIKPLDNQLLREQCLRIFLGGNELSEISSRDTH